MSESTPPSPSPLSAAGAGAVPPRPAIPDSAGLICGFALQQGPAQVLDWSSRSAGLPLEAPHWLHFNLADTRACNWIGACADVPEAARELLLGSDDHIRCEIFEGGVALVLGDLHHDFNGDPEGFGVMSVYLDARVMVSGRRHPLRAVDQVRRELQAGQVSASTAQLFCRLIEAVDDSFSRLIKTLSNDIDEAEDEVLAGRIHDQGGGLGRQRRLLARLRRHMGAGRQKLQQCVLAIGRWCAREDLDELRQAISRLDSTAQDLELVQERTRLLQEEIGSRLNEATNRNLYILSMVTVALLPINLITGIFGMNTGGLPWSESDHGFWWVMGGMIIAVGLSLRYLRSRNIF